MSESEETATSESETATSESETATNESETATIAIATIGGDGERIEEEQRIRVPLVRVRELVWRCDACGATEMVVFEAVLPREFNVPIGWTTLCATCSSKTEGVDPR